MITEAILFWFLAAVVLFGGLSVILFTNPIYSALSLAMTMVSVGALFVTLGAYFIAGVQLIVYAGAVMVLFVMVIMLIDLRTELEAFTSGKVSGVLKLISVGLLSGLIVGGIVMGQEAFFKSAVGTEISTDKNVSAVSSRDDNTKELGKVLFVKHVFSFEALGVLLTVIAVGAVALARSKGGTHAKH